MASAACALGPESGWESFLFGGVAMGSYQFRRARSFIAIPKSLAVFFKRSSPTLGRSQIPRFEVQQSWAAEIPGGTKARGKSIVRPTGRMPRVGLRLTVYSVLLVLASCASLIAQNSVLTGALGGRVTDESGAVAPGAKVVVRRLATGVDQSAETNHAGLYRFPAMMPGLSSVTATLKGFRDVQVLLRVQVGNARLQDVKLQVGASANAVTVSGTTPLLRPTESSSSMVVERSFIEVLPLNGRRYTDFAFDSHVRTAESHESIRRIFDLLESAIPAWS